MFTILGAEATVETGSSLKTSKKWRGEPGVQSSFQLKSTSKDLDLRETRASGVTIADNEELTCKFELITETHFYFIRCPLVKFIEVLR